jgi:hypothetical protein
MTTDELTKEIVKAGLRLLVGELRAISREWREMDSSTVPILFLPGLKAGARVLELRAEELERRELLESLPEPEITEFEPLSSVVTTLDEPQKG